MKLYRFSLFTLAAALLASPASMAQTALTSLHGTVTDQSSAMVSNAHVTISDLDTGFKAERLSDARGSYDFEQVAPGKYTILVEARGFASKKTGRGRATGQ